MDPLPPSWFLEDFKNDLFNGQSAKRAKTGEDSELQGSRDNPMGLPPLFPSVAAPSPPPVQIESHESSPLTLPPFGDLTGMLDFSSDHASKRKRKRNSHNRARAIATPFIARNIKPERPFAPFMAKIIKVTDPIPSNEAEEINQLYQMGCEWGTIAKKRKKSVLACQNIYKEFHATGSKKNAEWTPENDQRLAKLMETGFSYATVEQVLATPEESCEELLTTNKSN